ncbi:MAG: metallophosphoesterase [Planctomycetales bacterium]|nr:metallophosphoesterase [bacterium]UNM08413.1 MAG: metallophosphoesterase [Planctomycetales bacterium]
MSLVFMQLSDLHLGARLVNLPGEIAEHLRNSTREIVIEAFEAAKAENADLILMPGDLYDHNGIDASGQLHFIYELAASMASTPVVIAPGNHDPYSIESPYATIAAPSNVSLFTSNEFTTIRTSVCPVAGRAFRSGEYGSMIDWSSLPPAPSGPSVLMMHASVMNAGDGRHRESVMLPVTTTALEQSGYSFCSLGHYHTFQRFSRQSDGPAYAAYGGCPQGLGWDETGGRGFVIGRLREVGAELEYREASRHTWQRHPLQLPPWQGGESWLRLEQRLESIAEQLGEKDLLRLDIKGRWPATEKEGLRERINGLLSKAWHATDIDWSATAFTPPLAPRGVSPLLDEFLDTCEKHVDESSEEGIKEAWRLARYLGHRLLSGQGLPEELV